MVVRQFLWNLLLRGGKPASHDDSHPFRAYDKALKG